MLQPDQWNDLLKLFRVPGQPIYILGCFARHVTIYSQQVRALNLISALRRKELLNDHPKIAVIGGGAAGLMAAAAARYCGAHVTLLDKLDRPMQIQSSNRQRWLHPFIYNWPFTESSGSEARLPLLTWNAGYASDVAEQIQSQWEHLKKTTPQAGSNGSMNEQWSVKNIRIHNGDAGRVLTWTDKNKHGMDGRFAFVIMAVGFGLEADKDPYYSYWAEDRIDANLVPGCQESWFVSGTGDGGLTDVMRLCIHDFRHHMVKELFSEVDGIEQLKIKLREIHPEDRDPDEEWVHDQFREVLGLNAPDDPNPYRWDALTDVFRRPGMLRTISCVKLASKSRFLYGPQSSILNRLIISQLERLGKIEFIAAETKEIIQKNGRYSVQLDGEDAPFETDHVILRHGPASALQQSFRDIWNASQPLRSQWEHRGLNRDNTRLPHWDTDEFGPEKARVEAINIRRQSDAGSSAESISTVKEATSKPNKLGAELAGSVQLQSLADSGLGVRAERLSISKEVRSDGSSQIRYEIKGLSVIAGTVRGLLCAIRTTAGYMGTPALDEDALRLQIRWEQDSVEDRNPRRMNLPTAEEWAHRVSRTLYFNPPLTSKQGPISFGFSVSLINGDALSSWEFEQMYRKEKQVHINRDSISGSEFMARYVWFPVNELTMRITFPARIISVPFTNVFVCGRNITHTDVVRDGILQMLPGAESRLHPQNTYWEPDSPEARVTDAKYLTSISPQTWELAVPKPSVGSCYSLNWALPEKKPGPWIAARIEEAERFRDCCLRHGKARRAGEQGDKSIHDEFIELANLLRKRYGMPGNEDERFEVSLMTYDEETKYLLTFEALISDQDRMQEKLGSLKLPFGLGLAGTAFKECDKVHMYQRTSASKDYRASHYLPLYGSEEHEVLLAVPFEHPAISDMPPETGLWETFDRPRACLGILNLGSTHAGSPLKNPPGTRDLIDLTILAGSFAFKILNRIH